MTTAPSIPQLSPSGGNRRATDARVRDAMTRLPLAVYLAAQPLAGPDHTRINLGPPCPEDLVATMLSALEITGRERVLEIGSSSGYETALLSRLAADVVALDSDPESAKARARLLAELGCRNVRIFAGRGPAGWPDLAPYQGILIAGGTTRLPQLVLDQLDLGGRLVVPLGDAQGQLVQGVRKHLDGIVTTSLGTCHLPLLPWPRRPSHFPWTDKGGEKPSG